MKDRILQYLRENGCITSWEAITEFHCTRLSHYIYLLKKDGFEFDEEIVCTKNRYGDHTHYKKYILKTGGM